MFLDLKWWRDPDLNRGHIDFQSIALPTELSRQEIRLGHYRQFYENASLSFDIQSHSSTNRLFIRPHSQKVLILFMIISDDMKEWMNEKYLKFFFRKMMILLWLRKDFWFRKNAFSRCFMRGNIWKILKIMKRKYVCIFINPTVVLVQGPNFFIRKKSYIQNPILRNTYLIRNQLKNLSNSRFIKRKMRWIIKNFIRKHRINKKYSYKIIRTSFIRSYPVSSFTFFCVRRTSSRRSEGLHVSHSLIKKFAWRSDQYAPPWRYHLSHTCSIRKPADISREGFLKKLPHEFPFGCLFSRKSILSTSEWYFSRFSERSKQAHKRKSCGFSFRNEYRYVNFISSREIFLRFSRNISKTVARRKLDSISSPKHPAFPYIAPPIEPGSQINRCQISWEKSFSSVCAIAQIGSFENAWRNFLSWLYSQPESEFFTIIPRNFSELKRIFVHHQMIKNGILFSRENRYMFASFGRSDSVVSSKK